MYLTYCVHLRCTNYMAIGYFCILSCDSRCSHKYHLYHINGYSLLVLGITQVSSVRKMVNTVQHCLHSRRCAPELWGVFTAHCTLCLYASERRWQSLRRVNHYHEITGYIKSIVFPCPLMIEPLNNWNHLLLLKLINYMRKWTPTWMSLIFPIRCLCLSDMWRSASQGTGARVCGTFLVLQKFISQEPSLPTPSPFPVCVWPWKCCPHVLTWRESPGTWSRLTGVSMCKTGGKTTRNMSGWINQQRPHTSRLLVSSGWGLPCCSASWSCLCYFPLKCSHTWATVIKLMCWWCVVTNHVCVEFVSCTFRFHFLVLLVFWVCVRVTYQ